MSALFSPYTIGSLTVPNRIAVSPMCQYVADGGKATKWHEVHLSTMALSGAGLLFTEATAVEPAGRITPGDLGLWDDETEDALRKVLDTVRAVSNPTIIMQIAHAGRKASSWEPWKGGHWIPPGEGGWTTYAPSAIPQIDHEGAPEALDDAGLKRVREAFAATARRAAALDVDGLELHGAHGYLMHEFMSPISNRRTDHYGGSLENRLRYPLELFDAVREAFPADKPVGMKVSATDWIDGGWDIGQTIALAQALRKRGAAWITASSAGISPLQKIAVGPGYQIPFAEAIRKATGMTTIGVGLITEPQQAEDIIASEKADLVALARGMLYDPRWPWHAAAALNASIGAPPPPYWRAPPHGHTDLFRNTTYGTR